MSFRLFSRGCAPFFTILLTVATCLSISINANAQTPEAEQNRGAIDPLLFDFSHRPRSPQSSINNLSKDKKVSVDNKANLTPTAGELDPSLSAAIDSFPGNVRSTVQQADGKILVGGFFKTLNGAPYKSIVRLNSDYSIDPTFSASLNGTVMSIALQADGKIIIGGSFTVVGGTAQNRIARLNADGSLDPTFNTGAGADSIVYDVAVQPDGKILLGGSFVFVGTSLNYYVTRLNANGSVDGTFVSPIQPSTQFAPPSIVYSLALQADGRILLGGLIVVNGSNFPPVTTPVARLNADGSFDASFQPGTINSNLYDVAVQPDGKILIAGFFTLINGADRRYLARLNPDGSLDNSFNASAEASAPVLTVHLKADGKILFSSIVIIPSSGVAKQLNPDGSLDRAFMPVDTVTGQIYTILSTSNGKILTGGSFSPPFGGTTSGALLFNADGSPETSFRLDSTALGGVRAMAVQPDGKIIVAGNFNRINGTRVSRLARLNPDGTIDAGFNTTSLAPTQVSVLLLLPDGNILVGGTNLNASGNPAARTLVRLKGDGTIDNTFVPADLPLAGTATALALQTDGKILFSYLSASRIGGTVGGLSRLNADGSLDSTFTAPPLQYESIVALPDGKILAGGPTYIGYINSGTGESDFYYGVLRLNADGTHDRSFRAGFISEGARFTSVYTMALQPDGKILVGGSLFTGSATTPFGVLRLNPSGTIDGTFAQNTISSASEIARVEDLYLLPNGKILTGGFFDNLGIVPQNNLARLNANGVVDETFSAKTDRTVYDIDLQSQNKLLIGGDFETVNNVGRTSLARLVNQTVAQPQPARFDFEGDGKADLSVFRPASGEWWYSRSSDGQVPAAQFGSATDKPVPADFDGDGRADIAFFRPSTGEWFILRSSNGSFYSIPFGASGDIPAPADYDADGKADAAVFRPSAATWYISLSAGGTSIVQFGASGDVPVMGDYDGDGRADIAVFRPSDGSWWILRSSNGSSFSTAFGTSGDKPVAADYTGDGRTDIAVWRPSTGEWFVLRSEDLSYFSVPFGTAGDIPVAADYDGDGRTDFAVFRPSIATWYINRTTAGLMIQQFGLSDDLPAASAFLP